MFPGCDYTPAFFRKGKLRPFKLLEKSVEYQLACQEIITDDDDELERTFATLEKFICHMYGVPNSSNANDVRFYFPKLINRKNSMIISKRNVEVSIHRVYHHKRQPRIKVSIGDIVLVGADNKKRIDRPLGCISHLIIGRDGEVGLVRVQTSTNELLRPIQRIHPLEIATSYGPQYLKSMKSMDQSDQFNDTTILEHTKI
ncbi:uncharacterized protein TNCV_2455891 [Trichonephila clavipes]|nr:uncharacterized protein TNCV_2455891 [Trichonephila clavipes]